MPKSRVLILTSDTGGGHTSAARALEAGLNLAAGGATYLVHIARALEENGAITERFVGFYNYLLRHRQHYVKYYHWAINRFRPDRWQMLYRAGSRYGGQLLTRFGPNMIVSVHPMLQSFFSRLLGELGLRGQIPLVTVVTDPCGNSWSGWAADGVDLYIVAHDEARKELEALGVPGNRIRVCGMPIHPRFEMLSQMPEIRDAALAELELDPARFTVFVNAGWAGGGNIPALFDALLDSDLPIQMVFVAGRNEALRRDAEARAASARFPVRVLGFTEQMERVMAVASVMVSKLGGLTTFEALACGLPVLGDAVTPPMPQEERTARLLERTGAGLMVQQPREVVDAVRGLIANPDNYARVRRAARALGVPDATRRIVAELDGVLARTTERRARSVTGVA